MGRNMLKHFGYAVLRRSPLTPLLLLFLATMFGCGAPLKDSIHLSSMGQIDDQREVHLVWVDSSVEQQATDLLDLWRIHVGLLVIHDQPSLNRSISRSIHTRLAWHPQSSVELRRLGAPQGERIPPAPDIRDRYEFPPDFRPATLRFERTVELNDGRCGTLAVATVPFAELPGEGLYQIRLQPDVPPFRGQFAVNEQWFTFFLHRPENRSERSLAERVPWLSPDDDGADTDEPEES